MRSARRARVEVTLSGGLEVRVGSRVLRGADLGQRAETTLAVLLLAAGEAVSRDTLADAVWGVHPPPTWPSALRNIVARVRRELDGAGLAQYVAIRSLGTGYRVVANGEITTDADDVRIAGTQAEAALANGRPEDALAIADALLTRPQPSVMPAAGTEWLDSLRDRFAADRQRLLLTAAEAALAVQLPEQAERHARELVAASPLREDGHRLVMRALLAAGNRSAALKAYDDCRRLLAEEIGTRPSEQTESLFMKILLAEPQQQTPAEAPPGSELVRLAHELAMAAPPGDWRRAVRYGLTAARAARDAGFFEDAIAAATRALEALDQADNPDDESRLDLLILLGSAQRALADPRGLETLAEAARLASRTGDVLRMADAALGLTHGGAVADESLFDHEHLEVYERALAALGAADPARRAQLLGHAATGHAFRRDGARGRALVAQAVDAASALASPGSRLQVLTSARRTLSGSLELDLQSRLEAELDLLADQLDDPGARAATALWRFQTEIENGHGERLEGLLETAAHWTLPLRTGGHHHSLDYTRAALALLRGEIAAAERLVLDAAANGLRRGVAPEIVEAIRLAQMTGVRLEQDRVGELRDELVRFFVPTGLDEWRGLVSFAEAAAGNRAAATRHLSAFLDSLARTGATMLSPIAIAALMAEPISILNDRPRAKLLYMLLLPHSGSGGYAAFFGGPIDYSLGRLALTLGRPELARTHLADAVKFAERLGAPLWAARAASRLTELA